MNTKLAIFVSSVLGACTAGVMFSAADMSTKQTQPKVESTPAPVVVKEEPVNVVTVKDDWSVRYTVIRDDFKCYTHTDDWGVWDKSITHKRQCKVNGVRTDLAGYSVHDTEIVYCYESKDGGYSWEESGHAFWGCQAIYKLSAT